MQQEIIPHLFRTEYRKIVAVLCKRFGFNQLETAEDIASDTFLAAAQLWPLRGIPAQPTAWLYQVAKNKALNHFQRRQLFAAKIAPLLQLESLEEAAYQIDLSEENILDSQLRMIFAICNPLLSAEAQIAMALRVLCGFGVEEIAAAFLSNKETIQKRLTRAKEKLRAANLPLECPSAALMQDRLQNVLKTLYLLFNEGYYSHSNELLRKDLCLEAMRLTQMLVDHAPTQLPEVYALLALMCFQASRLNARKNEWGDIVLYADQDESQWNQPLLARGIQLLHLSSGGQRLSPYHLEASIAYWHTQKADTLEKWERILTLYQQLLQLSYTAVAALNRTYAFFKVRSFLAGEKIARQEALGAAEALPLKGNPFYHALLAELYTGIDHHAAIDHLGRAIASTKSNAEKNLLEGKLAALQTNDTLN